MSKSRNTSLRKSRKALSDINVVPYIDVMLVLLIIFMITAPLLTQGVQVNLPDAQAKSIAQTNQTPIVMSIDRLGNYYLNISSEPNQPVSAEQLQSEVATALQTAQTQNQTRDVYVKGDTAANYGQVVQAMALLQKAGAANVGLITSPTDNS
jgi:biopolymer transport protein TolR